MALAFHLLAHRDPAQVARLLSAIWHPDNLYVVHYDRRRPAREHETIQTLAASRRNVIVQQPHPVLWGRYSLYAAQLEGLRIALASGRPWTHWINLSGQCYPLIPVKRLMQDCDAAAEISFVRFFNPLRENVWSRPEDRLNGFVLDSPWLEWWLRTPFLGRRLRRLFGGENTVPRLPGLRRRLPDSFTWYGGDNWVTLSRTAASYVTGSPAAARITRALRRTVLPEESLFQSILLNSPLAPKVLNDHRRKIKWLPARASPELFTAADWPLLQEAARQGAWFARKFGPEIEIRDLIDRNLLSVSP